jgi:tetratricopeptide (TPR) repeat protein
VAASADLLSEPPARYPVLVPVPELDLSGAESAARDAIRGAREQVARLLARDDVAAAELAEAYGRLGAFYDVYRIRSGAELCYANAVALDPSAFRWAFLFAYLAHVSGRYDEAMERFARARTIDPEYPSVGLYEAEILLERNQVEKAAVALEAAMTAEGLRARAAFRLGQIALQRRQYNEAVTLFREALALDPQGDAAWFPLAQALRGTGDSEGARAALAKRGKQLPRVREPLLEELEALDHGSRPYYLSGLAAARRGDYHVAAEAFGQGLAQDPENAFARVSYARALYLSGHADNSREQLEIAAETAPGEPLPLFLLGLLDRAGADGSRARERFEQVLRLRADHSGALYFLGLMDFSSGDYARAATRLAAAVDAEPGNHYAQVLALVARQRNGEPDGVLAAELSELVAIFPEPWLTRYALARLLAASGEEGARDVARALALSQQLVDEQVHPAALEALALSHAADGDAAASETALDQARSEYLFAGRFGDANRIAAQQRRLADGALPSAAWPVEDPLFNPPPISVRGPFMEYPAARAY